MIVKKNSKRGKVPLKQRCVFFLEEQKFDGSFSKNCFDTLLKRIAPDYEIRVVQPVDFERGFLSKSDITKYFEVLKNLKIDKILPKLIINLDETGFGGSVSGRKKPIKYIVSRNYKGKLRYQYQEASSHITSHVGITASGIILLPCAIIKRGSENPDGSSCPYFG